MIYSLINKIFSRRPQFILQVVIAAVLCMGMSSCFKEKPIKPPVINASGDIFVANMGENYTKQIYFNLQTQVFTDSNSKYSYDMAFDCDPASYNIWINGSKLMFVCHTGKYVFADASFADTLSKGWHEELGSGVADQNAIGIWNSGALSNKEVFLVNLGEDSNGVNLGFKKMQMGDCVGDSYTVTFCDMDGSNVHTVSVPRKNNRNKIYLSFNDQQVHDFEPDYTNWDLIFTQYSVYFPLQNLPYKVTGVLTNPHKTLSYFVDSTSDYSKITVDSVKPSKFSPLLDNIGYDWKAYAYAEYTVNQNYIYIIKSDDRYYKLRFLDFYNAQGSKGYPKFQYDELL